MPSFAVFCLAGIRCDASFAINPGVCLMSASNFNNLVSPMKLAFIAAIAALFAASCCPNIQPAPNKPTYVAPTK